MRRRHQLEHGVLGSAHRHRAGQRAGRPHDDANPSRQYARPMPRLEARWSGAEADPGAVPTPPRPGPGGRGRTVGSSRRRARSSATSARCRPRRTARSPRPPATGSPSRGSVGCSRCPLAAACGAPPSHRPHGGSQPWWAPPERLDARAAHVLGLLAAAQLIDRVLQHPVHPDGGLRGRRVRRQRRGAGRGRLRRAGRHHPHASSCWPWPTGSGGGGSWSVRRSRRRSSPRSGALAPSLAVLTVMQTIARPVAISLGLVVAIVAAEEMPPGSRAYAMSVLGAGLRARGRHVRLGAPPRRPRARTGWRLVYAVGLVYLVVAVSLYRGMPGEPALRAPPRRAAAAAAAALPPAGRVGVPLQPAHRRHDVLREPLPEGRPRLLGDADRASSPS